MKSIKIIKLLITFATLVIFLQETWASGLQAIKYLDEILYLAEKSTSARNFDELLEIAKGKRIIPDHISSIDDIIELIEDPAYQGMKEVEDIKSILKRIKSNPHEWRLLLKYRAQIDELLETESFYRRAGSDMARDYKKRTVKKPLKAPAEGPDTAPRVTIGKAASEPPKPASLQRITPVPEKILPIDLLQELRQQFITLLNSTTKRSFDPQTVRRFIEHALEQGHGLERSLEILTDRNSFMRFLRRTHLQERIRILDELEQLPQQASIDRISKLKELDLLERTSEDLLNQIKKFLPPSPGSVVRESIEDLANLRDRFGIAAPGSWDHSLQEGTHEIMARVHEVEDASEEIISTLRQDSSSSILKNLEDNNFVIELGVMDDHWVVRPQKGSRIKKAVQEIGNILTSQTELFLTRTDSLLGDLSLQSRIQYLQEVSDIRLTFQRRWSTLKEADLSTVSDYFKSLHQALDSLSTAANPDSLRRVPRTVVESLFARDSKLGKYLEDLFNRDNILSPWGIATSDSLSPKPGAHKNLVPSKIFEGRRTHRLITTSSVVNYVYQPLMDTFPNRADLGIIHFDTVAVIRPLEEMVPSKFATAEEYYKFRALYGAQLNMDDLKKLRQLDWSRSAIVQNALDAIHPDNIVFRGKKTLSKIHDILTTGTAFSVIGDITKILVGSSITAGFFLFKEQIYTAIGWEVPEFEKSFSKDKREKELRFDKVAAETSMQTATTQISEFEENILEYHIELKKIKIMKNGLEENPLLISELDQKQKYYEFQIQKNLSAIDTQLRNICRVLIRYDEYYPDLSLLLEGMGYSLQRTKEKGLQERTRSIRISFKINYGDSMELVELNYKQILDEHLDQIRISQGDNPLKIKENWVRILMELPEDASDQDIIEAVIDN